MIDFSETIALLRWDYKTHIEVFTSLWLLKLCVINWKARQFDATLEHKEIVDSTVTHFMVTGVLFFNCQKILSSVSKTSGRCFGCTLTSSSRGHLLGQYNEKCNVFYLITLSLAKIFRSFPSDQITFFRHRSFGRTYNALPA